MGDMGDDFRVMREHRKELHEKWHKANRSLIDASGLPYEDKGEALLFRIGSVSADFYPSTGRWRVAGERDTYRGGGRVFLNWLRSVTGA